MPDGARILARDAARGGRALHLALERAADDLAGGLIAARNAADLRVALHHAGERAADDLAVVLARDAAAGDLIAARSHGARNIQVCHASAGQDRAEQPGGAGIFREIEIGDGMSASFKRAAEGGCRRKVHAGKRNIRAQDEGFSLRPGIEQAVFRKRGKIVGGVQIDSLRAIRCRGCRENGQAKRQHQQHRTHAGPKRSVIHARHPPFPSAPAARPRFPALPCRRAG